MCEEVRDCIELGFKPGIEPIIAQRSPDGLLRLSETSLQHLDGLHGRERGDDLADQVLVEDVVALVDEEGQGGNKVMQNGLRRWIAYVAIQPRLEMSLNYNSRLMSHETFCAQYCDIRKKDIESFET